MKKFVRAVDAFNEFFGKYVALLIVPLVLVVTYEVILRKIFHSPTVWAFEMTVYLYGAHFLARRGIYLPPRSACAHRHSVFEVARQGPVVAVYRDILHHISAFCRRSDLVDDCCMPVTPLPWENIAGAHGSRLCTFTNALCRWALSCCSCKAWPTSSATSTG